MNENMQNSHDLEHQHENNADTEMLGATSIIGMNGNQQINIELVATSSENSEMNNVRVKIYYEYFRNSIFFKFFLVNF